MKFSPEHLPALSVIFTSHIYEGGVLMSHLISSHCHTPSRSWGVLLLPFITWWGLEGGWWKRKEHESTQLWCFGFAAGLDRILLQQRSCSKKYDQLLFFLSPMVGEASSGDPLDDLDYFISDPRSLKTGNHYEIADVKSLNYDKILVFKQKRTRKWSRIFALAFI